jgi:hypothetical protein
VNRILRAVLILLLMSLSSWESNAAKEIFYQVGAARIDITPDYPSGSAATAGGRKGIEGIDQHLFAKALAIGERQRRCRVVAHGG